MTDLTVGAEFGPSSWIDIPQETIDAFAEATGDHSGSTSIRSARRRRPFGTTIGHGYLTLSLLPVMSYEVVPRQGGGMAVNYGLNRVRFPAPVRSGSRVRGSFRVDAVDEVEWGFQATMAATVAREGGEKPVCVAELVFRYYRLRTRGDARPSAAAHDRRSCRPRHRSASRSARQ